MTKAILTLAQMQEINHLSWHEQKSSTEIARLLYLDPDDCEAVIRGRYVEHVRAEFIDDSAITMHQFNEIRRRYKPKDSLNNEYALAVEFKVDPKTVLKIVRSQFSNAQTHPPVAAATTAADKVSIPEPVAPEMVRKIYTAIGKSGYTVTDVATAFNLPKAVAAQINTLRQRSWSVDDTACEINRRYLVAATPPKKAHKANAA